MKKYLIILGLLIASPVFADTPYYLFATSSYNTYTDSSIYYATTTVEFLDATSTTMTWANGLSFCQGLTNNGGGWGYNSVNEINRFFADYVGLATTTHANDINGNWLSATSSNSWWSN